MEVRAQLRYLRKSPRKVRLVVDLVRGLPVRNAIAQLRVSKKGSARSIKKLIESAVANAENNFKINREGLFVKTIMVDKGPTLKRWRPRAFGRAGAIRKRTSHITVILAEDEALKKAAQSVTKGSTKKDESKKTVAKKSTTTAPKASGKKKAEVKKDTPKAAKKAPKMADVKSSKKDAPVDPRRQAGKQEQPEKAHKKEVKKNADA